MALDLPSGIPLCLSGSSKAITNPQIVHFNLAARSIFESPSTQEMGSVPLGSTWRTLTRINWTFYRQAARRKFGYKRKYSTPSKT